MSLLSSTISDSPRLQSSFILLQSSIAQSSVPILRQILTNNIKSQASSHFLLFFFAHPPSNILTDVPPVPENVQIFDWIDTIPGYSDDSSDSRAAIISAVKKAPSGTVQVVIDSIDTLCSDIGTVSETYTFLLELLNLLRNRASTVPNQHSAPSRLILHATRPSKLVPLLIQPVFSRSLIHLTAHPIALLTHMAKEYLISPPPSSQKAKFWATFLPLSERTYDVERLVYGAEGRGGGGISEMIVDILMRSNEGFGRKRVIEREIEGWSLIRGACDLADLSSLKELWNKRIISEAIPDPTHNASFNLKLTSSQQESRAKVPLPYAHEGNLTAQKTPIAPATIYYDPDSADDIDDDDPDEDLDI